jgi:hypothetical protein
MFKKRTRPASVREKNNDSLETHTPTPEAGTPELDDPGNVDDELG